MGSIVSHLPALSKPVATALIAASSGALFMFEDKIGNTPVKLMHLGCFATWFGTQIWVTFVAGNFIYNKFL